MVKKVLFFDILLSLCIVPSDEKYDMIGSTKEKREKQAKRFLKIHFRRKGKRNKKIGEFYRNIKFSYR